MDRFDRYLKIAHWLNKRYQQANGVLVVSVGGIPSKWNRLDLAFFNRYIVNGRD